MSAVGLITLLALLGGGLTGEAKPHDADDPRVEPPRRVSGDAPPYPPEAKSHCAEGTVRLQAVVGVDGLVSEVEVLERGKHDMGQLARESVHAWTYEPGTLKSTGEPVEVKLPLTFEFEDPCPDPPAGPLRVGGDVEPPRRLSAPAPVYTREAREDCVRGTAVIETIVGVDGTAKHARILKDLPAGLGEAARQAVLDWVYEPATTPDGQPVEVIYTMTVNFEMEGSSCDRLGPVELTPLSTPKPEADGFEGVVTAVLKISREGNVSDVKVFGVHDRKLKRNIVRALSKWRYAPPTNPDTGKRTKARIDVSLTYP